jgi:2-polyprenyl-3-methyl-5-hydroxy-6-metoxy-1,4-benzoquinol methylase
VRTKLYAELASLTEQQFDTIIYIDVLEHIHNDREELNQAASHLPAGRSSHRPVARPPAPLFAVRRCHWALPALQSADAAKDFRQQACDL